MIAVPRLLLVTNRVTAKLPIADLAAKAIAGGVDVVQIREKDLSEAELRYVVQQVLAAVGEPTRVMVNGSPQIAAEFGIGLHLPDGSVPLAGIDRSAFPLFSTSVHAPADLSGCARFDFVVAGHLFETKSKQGLTPLGIEGLGRIVNACPAPVIAIGGITPDRVSEVIAAGAKGIAVQSAINDSDDPETAARQFSRSLENAMSTPRDQMITIEINGKPVNVAARTSVADYLKAKGYHDRLVVVELNGAILSKSAFATTPLSAGDRVEIVHFVGGG